MQEDDVLEEIKTFISSHMNREITLSLISNAVCYSEEYTSRFFKRKTGSNLFDYIREQRLLLAAREVREKRFRVIDIALTHGFESHEGFTRAFTTYFGISPRQFRKYQPEIKEFMPRGFKVFPLEGKENLMDTLTIFTRIVERPERQFLLMRAKKAEEYFAYSEEVGCDIWGRLLEVKEALFEPLGFWLPEPFRPQGTGSYAQGVEVPLDYSGPVPDDLELLALPPCHYLVFHSEPYEENIDTMMKVINKMKEAIQRYDVNMLGYAWAPDDAPRFQTAPIGERGYMEGLPVRPLQK